MALLRETVGAALDGAYAGLALLGASAAVLAGAPPDVLGSFWVAGLIVVLAGPVFRSMAGRLRSRRGSGR